MSAARIGKITLKAGGAQVRLFRQALPDDGENWRGEIIRHARLVAEHQPKDQMVGFLVIALFDDGGYSVGSRMSEDAKIGRTMLPSYVAEIVRRDVLMEPLANGQI